MGRFIVMTLPMDATAWALMHLAFGSPSDIYWWVALAGAFWLISAWNAGRKPDEW